jgi:hypothetical protein
LKWQIPTKQIRYTSKEKKFRNMAKPKILFSVANDSKALYPHLYKLNDSPKTESNDYTMPTY